MAVYSIPAGESFVDALARQLLTETAADPMSLVDYLILLPTRRACRALRDAFLRAADGRALLLPRLQPLGDAGEDDEISLQFDNEIDVPPAVPPLRRLLLLARAVQMLDDKRGGLRPTPEQAVRLAAELADLLDQVQIEGLAFESLATLVPDDYAAHWQVTLNFLSILTEHWPVLLAEQGWIDAADRRNRLLDRQAAAWQATPPASPVIAAGSTGSIPAVARLLAVIARLPNGRVVLPGLDPQMTPDERRQLDDSHPQWGLSRLLARLDVDPAAVLPWPGCRVHPRAWLAAQALRPAAVTEQWQALRGHDPGAALDGLHRLDCPGPREESTVVALLLREALETPGRTAALVTPDRGLARRVAAELQRYAIDIDDSAGTPLMVTPPGAFLLLTAEMVADGFAPHATLAALKHPLATGGLPAGQFRRHVRRFEQAVLRGPRAAPGIAGLRAAVAALAQGADEMADWLASWADSAAGLESAMASPAATLASIASAHLALVETLAGDDVVSGTGATGTGRPWQGEAGEAAHAFLVALLEAADALTAFEGRLYPGLLRSLMEDIAVRPRYGRHPRLFIWGPLEARLQHVDRLILGGLNEGVWPPEPAVDPWMSRPMRRTFGLPPPERRIGLSAHDFVQAFCAPEVFLTRATRADGAPTVPSRWLQRLDAVLRACTGSDIGVSATDWLSWAAELDRPRVFVTLPAPAPCPPVEARPRRLSATAIETWMRDPYAIYARWILGLKVLDPIDADPGAADYGSLVHGVLHAFLLAYPAGPLPPTARQTLIELGQRSFAGLRPGLLAFWGPRFDRIADWFITVEQARRPGLRASHGEIAGSLTIAAPFAPFTLTARADRIDLLASGGLAVIDYKTGAPPSVAEVAAGYAPQLPLEAAIAQAGGFAAVPAHAVEQMLFWRLSGGGEGGSEHAAGDDAGKLAASALAGLTHLVAVFDDPATPYRARPNPDRAPRFSDTLHLARVREWASGEEDEG